MKQENRSPSFPFAEEDAVLARQSWLQANMTPKAAILAGKLLNLLLLGLLVYVTISLVRAQAKLGEMRIAVVRVNDIGRAEVVRLDTDYVPREPEIRDQIERFTIRYYTRHGFSIPEALESMPIYMEPGLFETWRKEAVEAISTIAKGEGLLRVRILNCRIENLNNVKTTGATATIRFATDAMLPNGAVAGGNTLGYEVVIRFKVGVYPTEIKDPMQKDQWIVRNPLGVKVFAMQRTQYTGADVEDRTTERVIDIVKQRAEDEAKREEIIKGPKQAL